MSTADKKSKSRFPKEIAIALILFGALVSLGSLAFNQSTETVIVSLFSLLMNFVLIPAVFLVLGGLQKLREREFNLWNAYFVGLLVAILLAIQKVVG
ncbi:hypothetical protein [Rheinheimera sp.]|uniref:hypothetical protein n=1 Tax=Rheinheimera sp. TaxID=1869214 RepID=UPI0037C89AAC